MKTAVFLLGSLSVVLGHQWRLPQPVHDTPEVAAAKSAHLNAIAKAKTAASSWAGPKTGDGSWRDDGSWRNYDDGSCRGEEQSWNQELDSSWLGQSWNGAGHHSDVHEKKWTGPVALPPGYDKNGAPLPVQDTPEVAAEKSKHYHSYHQAAANAKSFSYGA